MKLSELDTQFDENSDDIISQFALEKASRPHSQQKKNN